MEKLLVVRDKAKKGVVEKLLSSNNARRKVGLDQTQITTQRVKKVNIEAVADEYDDFKAQKS